MAEFKDTTITFDLPEKGEHHVKCMTDLDRLKELMEHMAYFSDKLSMLQARAIFEHYVEEWKERN